MTSGKLSKGDKMVAVDHATMNYPPFRKNFYIEVGGHMGARGARGRGGCGQRGEGAQEGG